MTHAYNASPPRIAACRVLLHLAENRFHPVQSALDMELGKSRFSPQDTALCTELVYGVLRRDTQLMHVLSGFMKRPGAVPPLMLIVLKLAAFELIHLDRIPGYASVDWAVGYIRKKFGQPLSRVANAVLRNVAGLGDAPRSADFFIAPGMSTAQHCAVCGSLPLWLADFFVQHYGAEKALAISLRSLQTPWQAVRINRTKPQAAELRAELLTGQAKALGEFGLMFPPGAAPATVRQLEKQGLLSFQGAGSQTAMLAVAPYMPPEAPVWDACAGFGGKSTWLAEAGYTLAVASDPHKGRIGALAGMFTRLGLTPPTCLVQAGVQDTFLREVPPTILLDAPCSGLGTLARRPDIKLHASPERIRELELLQQQLLCAAWQALPAHGTLVYMTCTLNPQENQQQVAKAVLGGKVVFTWESPLAEHGEDMLYAAVLRKV